MRVNKITTIVYTKVETEGGSYDNWRKPIHGGDDSWEVLMGDSWEPYYEIAVELNKAIEHYYKRQVRIMTIKCICGTENDWMGEAPLYCSNPKCKKALVISRRDVKINEYNITD